MNCSVVVVAGAVVVVVVVVGAVVVVGCEGYWVINPNVVGIPSPNWQPQP